MRISNGGICARRRTNPRPAPAMKSVADKPDDGILDAGRSDRVRTASLCIRRLAAFWNAIKNNQNKQWLRQGVETDSGSMEYSRLWWPMEPGLPCQIFSVGTLYPDAVSARPAGNGTAPPSGSALADPMGGWGRLLLPSKEWRSLMNAATR